MKKQDGYILVFTLVVMTVVTIFVLAISSAALRSFNVQSKSLGALQSEYEAESKLQAFEGLINNAGDVAWPDDTVGLQSVVDSFLSAVSVPGVSHGARTINVVQLTDSNEVIVKSLDNISVDYSFNEMHDLLDDPNTNGARCQIVIPDITITTESSLLSAEIVINLDVQVDEVGYKLHTTSVRYSSYSLQEGGA